MQKKKSYKLKLLSFTLLYSFVMIVGNTFSWMSSSDSVKNELYTGDLHVILQEVFTPNLKWKAGATSKKVITVKNIGKSPAVVRVKLTENFLNFQFQNSDQNGKLVTLDSSYPDTVRFDDVSTWDVSSPGSASRTYTENDVDYYIANEYSSNYTIFKDTRETLDPFKYINIEQDPLRVKFEVDLSANNYWVYTDGWFYYSEILKPGESSAELMTSLKVADNLPHSYKFALYKMDVSMEALGAANGVLAAWSDLPAGSTGDVYSMLSTKLAAY